MGNSKVPNGGVPGRPAPLPDVRQDKSGASNGCEPHPGKGEAHPPGIESWAYGGNNMG